MYLQRPSKQGTLLQPGLFLDNLLPPVPQQKLKVPIHPQRIGRPVA
jgi:hypothetical protein